MEKDDKVLYYVLKKVRDDGYLIKSIFPGSILRLQDKDYKRKRGV